MECFVPLDSTQTGRSVFPITSALHTGTRSSQKQPHTQGSHLLGPAPRCPVSEIARYLPKKKRARAGSAVKQSRKHMEDIR